MNRGIPLPLVILLLVAAVAATLGAERYLSSPAPTPTLTSAAPSTPTPTATSTGKQRARSRDKEGKAETNGIIEAISGSRLVLRDVSAVRGLEGVIREGRVTVELEPDTQILREIAATDLRRGQRVTLRLLVENGRVLARQVIVEK